MKVLIIQQKMIGDVLTSTVLCEAIKLFHPDWEVHYLINANTKAVVQSNPFIDNVLLVNKEEQESVLKLIKFAQKLRDFNYDIVIDVYSKLSSNLISFISGADIKISKRKNYTKLLYTHTLVESKESTLPTTLAIYNRLQLLKPLGIDADTSLKPKIYITDDERLKIKILLESQGLDLNKPLIMIGILGSSKDKSYPPTYMAKLLDAVVEYRPEVQLLFNYIPKQEQSARAIYKLCKTETQNRIYIDVYGSDLRSFINILSNCDMLIGNEGGATNMAKALNIPSFTIFSPWIRKEAWHVSDSEKEMGFHLKDVLPEAYKNKSLKQAKKEASDLYQLFSPELVIPKLKNFLEGL